MLVTKMQALGNDFCVLDYEKGINYSKLAVKMCNRKLGVGSDGMIVVKQNPTEMLFYNEDGSMAPMCGNGIRCFAKYCLDKGITKGGELPVITGAGPLSVEITDKDNFMCKVNMGKPIFDANKIDASVNADLFGYTINVCGVDVKIYSFFMGTVHTVVYVDSFDADVLKIAKEIHEAPLFTKKTNVNFVVVKNKDEIDVKTYERGVGWTLACGTGCCASAVASNKLGLTNSKVRVNVVLGYLDIEYTNNGTVFMTGPAKTVFECEYEEDK